MINIMDGNEILVEALDKLQINLNELIAATSIWASMEYCKELELNTGISVRFPNVRRKRHYEKKGDVIDGIRLDDNTYANNAIKNAIGINRKDLTNFHTCHIYPNTCYDERYHTKIQNLVLLPNSIAQLSDNFDEVKKILQYRSFELYGWYPEEEMQPTKPLNYPLNWRDPIELNKQISPKILHEENRSIALEIDKEIYFDREKEEIEKVYNRVPKWLNKGKTQINSTILITFLELLDDKGFVSRELLKDKCELLVNDFKGNFSQMAQFGVKNHGKVFEVDKDEVKLWEPISNYVMELYKNNYQSYQPQNTTSSSI